MTDQTKKAMCPTCGSSELLSAKRGWTVTTGVFGMNKIQYTCTSCGKKFMEKKAVFN